MKAFPHFLEFSSSLIVYLSNPKHADIWLRIEIKQMKEINTRKNNRKQKRNLWFNRTCH